MTLPSAVLGKDSNKAVQSGHGHGPVFLKIPRLRVRNLVGFHAYNGRTKCLKYAVHKTRIIRTTEIHFSWFRSAVENKTTNRVPHLERCSSSTDTLR